MTVRILVGDCRKLLAGLPEKSVNCVVTSPPYWGLRDYGVEPSVWGGDSSCEHDWLERTYYTENSAAKSNGSAEAFSQAGPANAERLKAARWRSDSVCSKCSGWLGALGLEPSPEMFVEHMVEVFEAIRRVLADDGTLWLNLGDSYSRGTRVNDKNDSKRGTGLHSGVTEAGAYAQVSKTGSSDGAVWRGDRHGSRAAVAGLASKQLLMIPARVALAMQAAGWFLRMDIIWHKPNPMPESVTDRPTKAHEYLFLMSKSERYFYDGDAIREALAPASVERLSQDNLANQNGSNRAHAGGKTNGTMKAVRRSGNKERQFRHEHGGIDDSNARQAFGVPWEDDGSGRNARSVWTVPTQPFKEAHFAVMPPALAEKCVLAGSKKGGVILDPFGGAGTTGLVADRLGRDAILLELNPEYAQMAERRIHGDSPLFADVRAT